MCSWGLTTTEVYDSYADTLSLVVWTAAVLAVTLTPLANVAPLRIATSLPWLLFAPGYGLVACLFPADTLDGLERTALSVGGSLAVVLFGTLVVARGGVDTLSAVASLTLATLGLTLLAAVRRRRLPTGERYTPPRPDIASRLGELEPSTSTDGLLNAALLLALVVAAATAGVATVAPPEGERFTEVALASQTDNGTYTVNEYPERLTRGEPTPFAVTVGNHERQEVRYTLVVALQQPTSDDFSTLERLHTRSFTLAGGESVRWDHSVTPTTTASRVRLSYLLYRSSPPAAPTPTNAYRDLHLRVNVTASAAARLPPEQKRFY